MRMALGLLDITAIKKSANEKIPSEKDNSSPKKRLRQNDDFSCSAKLPKQEKYSPLKD